MHVLTSGRMWRSSREGRRLLSAKPVSNLSNCASEESVNLEIMTDGQPQQADDLGVLTYGVQGRHGQIIPRNATRDGCAILLSQMPDLDGVKGPLNHNLTY